MTNTEMTLHAHVSESSRDCDGAHGHDYVALPNDDERAEFAAGEARGYNNFADLSFKQRILGGAVSWSPLVKCMVTIREEGFHAEEVTDEGYRAREVRWCEDTDCNPDAYALYDQYAEMSGY